MTNHNLSLQITQTSNFLIKSLGDSLQGLYLYGSYVDGGLKHKSDLDIFVVVNEPLNFDIKKTLIQNLLLLSGAIDNKENKRYLEFTVINQTKLTDLHFPLYREFQYGEWLRDNFLHGSIPEAVIDHDLTDCD
ncbi:nucleotidyltransferase domain-containing protein [Sphingobacterium sp. ML3W]|uniref:nucleotidyltransferase domain-containing protein n=1 Tax=Sphingobacterium sp. ML3W TaxID=1538644 RepID=UPI00249CEF49|nr:nucleotidyltransferase domain-containing protein [Sphingobacterium sp. ML3W]WFA82417.1 nucleotidyltransferase domain-containing protein [Sphingobacterium sp. ML3W]